METPNLSVLIIPQFDLEEVATGLKINLTFSSSLVGDGGLLVEFPAHFAKISDEKEPLAHDAEGVLPVVLDTSETGTICHAARKPVGDIVIGYGVSASLSDESKSDIPKLGLYRDQGGLLGSGYSFLASPPLMDAYDIAFEWDLSAVPEGMRAVWTYGEDDSLITKVGPFSLLKDAVFMIGQIHSYPPPGTTGRMIDYYGYYWFGDLPPNIDVIKTIHHDFYMKMSEYFDSTPSKENCYRSFVRNTGSTKSFGGTAFAHSHIFDYDNQINKASNFDLVRRLSYEMNQHWLGPSAKSMGMDWLYEGMNVYLSMFMPGRNKIDRTGAYFLETFNMLCTRYYTNPLTQSTLTLDDVLERVPSDPYAREHISTRAWAFVIWADLKARRITQDKMPELMRPVEDLVMKPIVKEKSRGELQGIDKFISMLEPLMKDDIKRHYNNFTNGVITRLFTDLFGGPNSFHILKGVAQEVLDFGMDRDSFVSGIVKHLKVGSRAEIAGIMEGDKIGWSSHEVSLPWL